MGGEGGARCLLLARRVREQDEGDKFLYCFGTRHFLGTGTFRTHSKPKGSFYRKYTMFTQDMHRFGNGAKPYRRCPGQERPGCKGIVVGRHWRPRLGSKPGEAWIPFSGNLACEQIVKVLQSPLTYNSPDHRTFNSCTAPTEHLDALVTFICFASIFFFLPSTVFLCNALKMLGLSTVASLLCLAIWLKDTYAADTSEMKSIPVRILRPRATTPSC